MDDSASCADLTQENTPDPASDAAAQCRLLNADAVTAPATDIREIALLSAAARRASRRMCGGVHLKQYGIVTGELLFRPCNAWVLLLV